MKRRLVAVALTALALTACSSEPPEITSGTVIDKQFTAGYWWMMPVASSCGTNCNTTMYVPMYEPDKYVISIGSCSGECKTASLSVEPSTYNDLDIGEEYPRTAPAVPPKEPS